MSERELHLYTALRPRLETLFADYVHCIDDDRLEDWPRLFVDDGVYRIVTRENFDLGLPIGIMHCTGRAMLEDRVTALRSANIYEPHTYRHIISAIQTQAGENGEHRVQSGFSLLRVMHTGEITMFNCGRYLDRVVEEDGVLKFKERIVVLDSRRVDTLLVIPV